MVTPGDDRIQSTQFRLQQAIHSGTPGTAAEFPYFSLWNISIQVPTIQYQRNLIPLTRIWQSKDNRYYVVCRSARAWRFLAAVLTLIQSFFYFYLPFIYHNFFFTYIRIQPDSSVFFINISHNGNKMLLLSLSIYQRLIIIRFCYQSISCERDVSVQK